MRVWEGAVCAISKIAKHHPQCALAGMQHSLQQECQFLQRNVDSRRETFSVLEEKLSNTFLPSLFDTDLPSRDLTCLGVKEGGIGVGSPEVSVSTNRCASKAMTKHLFDTLVENGEFSLSTHTIVVREARRHSNEERRNEGSAARDECLKVMTPKCRRIVLRAPETGYGYQPCPLP